MTKNEGSVKQSPPIVLGLILIKLTLTKYFIYYKIQFNNASPNKHGNIMTTFNLSHFARSDLYKIRRGCVLSIEGKSDKT